jgi:soluble lytic murein transglycosylase-like protein
MLFASFLAAPPTAHAASNANELVREGIRYENAEGFPRDYDKALELYCAAARMNDADAFLRMGWMYANARGQARDDQIANTLFRRAASLGNEAAARLAQMVRGEKNQDKLPECLTRRASSPSPRGEGLTPVVERPAEFGAMPAGARLALGRTIVKLAGEFQLDPRLVFAVLRTESNFDPLARSAKNAQGLMQLIPETAERFAVRNAFDPQENLRGGMRYLRWLLSYFKGDVVLALAGYNAGEGAVDRARGVPPYPETLAYVQRIRALYPHDHHPFDARVTDPSPWLQKQARQAALEMQGTTRQR